MADSRHRLSRQFRVSNGDGFELMHVDPGSTDHAEPGGKQVAAAALAQGVERMAELQDKLYAQDRWALLLIFRPWMPPAKTAPSSM